MAERQDEMGRRGTTLIKEKRKSRIERKTSGEISDWATLREAWAVYLYVRDYILLGQVVIYTREYIRSTTFGCSIECLLVAVVMCKEKMERQFGGSCWPASHRPIGHHHRRLFLGDDRVLSSTWQLAALHSFDLS